MIPYKNLWGNSNVVAYQNWADFIIIQFASWTHTIYTYTYSSAWASAIETMKNLAYNGYWLNSYISTYKPSYISKK